MVKHPIRSTLFLMVLVIFLGPLLSNLSIDVLLLLGALALPHYQFSQRIFMALLLALPVALFSGVAASDVALWSGASIFLASLLIQDQDEDENESHVIILGATYIAFAWLLGYFLPVSSSTGVPVLSFIVTVLCFALLTAIRLGVGIFMSKGSSGSLINQPSRSRIAGMLK